MKKRTTLPIKASRLVCAALLSGALATSAWAANDSSSSRNHSDRSSSEQASGTAIRVTRASNFLGSDVMSNDNHKLGDISDYIYDTAATPHLKYVLVVSGGWMGVGSFGGDTRAIPASALSTDNGTVKLDMSQDQFWGVPVLPQNHLRYLRDSNNADRIYSMFKGSKNQENGDKADSGQSLVSFSELNNSDVYDKNDRRLGRIVDTWVSLDSNRAPYVEISAPPASPFQVLPRHRYAVPMSELRLPTQNDSDFRLSITENNLRDSKYITDAEGVKILKSGFVGREVLQVRVAQD